MHTVLLIRNAAPTDFGGAETYQISLATTLAAHKIHPIIVTRSAKLLAFAQGNNIDTRRGWWWSRQNWSGTRIALVPLYVLWQLLLTCWYIQLIWRTKASALHIQSKDDFIAATLAGRLTGRTVIWTDHMDLRYVFQNIARPLRNPVGKLVFWTGHLAHHIILISNNEHRLVTGCFKRPEALRRQIIIIKNGVIDQYERYAKNAQPASGIFSFCLASRMVLNKGVGDAIRAFIQLEKQLGSRRIRLDIYGDGPDIMTFRSMADGHPNIVFHGHQQDAKQKVFQSDVFMLPSYQEGFSIALLEATMLGKAIIASDVDSNSEIITNNTTGILIRPRDTKSIAEAMATLATNPDLCMKLGAQARRRYVENFDLSKIVEEQLMPLYGTY